MSILEGEEDTKGIVGLVKDVKIFPNLGTKMNMYHQENYRTTPTHKAWIN